MKVYLHLILVVAVVVTVVAIIIGGGIFVVLLFSIFFGPKIVSLLFSLYLTLSVHFIAE